jgi:hypothetical protein
MERKSAFVEGFFKAASLATAAKSLKNKALLVGGVGATAYGGSKLLSATENPEQKRMRQLRKAKMLPYQSGI